MLLIHSMELTAVQQAEQAYCQQELVLEQQSMVGPSGAFDIKLLSTGISEAFNFKSQKLC